MLHIPSLDSSFSQKQAREFLFFLLLTAVCNCNKPFLSLAYFKKNTCKESNLPRVLGENSQRDQFFQPLVPGKSVS